ncbi:hypothetical protein MMC28_006752 [Mycoblastus sanguinarius]|nr:hypothetical protein [Mycoblastus sanguinarius]
MFLPPQPFKTSFIFAFAVAVSQLSSNAAAQASTNLTNLLLPINDTIVLPIPSSLDEYWPVTTAASLSTLPPLNASSLNVSAAGPPKIACNGKLHGKNLNLASCVAAYNTIDAQTVIKTFGERGHGEWDINLPFRFQSSDGLCAIDVSHKTDIFWDHARPADLKEIAKLLIDICVRGDPNLGGVATNVGENGALTIRITPYRPNVHCNTAKPGPPFQSCRNILDEVPVDGTPRVFGPRDHPDTTVVLPVSYTTPRQRCNLFMDYVDPAAPSDTTDWYKVWAAAMSVETMCVDRGYAGVALGVGKNKNLFLELRDLRQQESSFQNSTSILDGLDVTS